MLAWLSMKHRRFGCFIVAGWTGFEMGAALANLLYCWIPYEVFFWFVIVTAALVVSCVTIVNPNKHMIWVTAIFGAYIFCLTLSYFFARWPIDLDLPDLYRKGAVDKSATSGFFIAIGSWMCISMIGAVFQFYILWYYKKTGKEIHPRLREAVETFEYGRTAEQRERDKKNK